MYGITITMVETERESIGDVGVVRFDEADDDGTRLPITKQVVGPVTLSFAALKIMHADISKKPLKIDVSVEVSS